MPCGLGSEPYTWHFFGPSSYSLQIAVGHRANARLITWQLKNHNICFFELWPICVVADFPLDFPVVFMVSIIMNRLRYIIESCQTFQTVLFSGLRNISRQILGIVGRVWNEGSCMLCQWLPSPSTTTRCLVLQNLPFLGLPALIRSPPTRAFPFSLRTTSNKVYIIICMYLPLEFPFHLHTLASLSKIHYPKENIYEDNKTGKSFMCRVDSKLLSK